MRKYNYLFTINLVVFLLFFFSTANASAKTVTFEKEYTYQASEIDSKVSSRAIALEQIKRLLLDAVGTYLISETKVKNSQLTKDQITTYSAGVVSAEVIDEKWDGKTYYLKAKVSADPDEVAKSIKTIGEDKQKKKELEETRKKAKDALKEIERLKKETEALKKNPKKQEEYAKAVKELSEADWWQKGVNLIGKFGKSGKHKEKALDAFSKAIELDPNAAGGYRGRGFVYAELKNYQQAINDYTQEYD